MSRTCTKEYIYMLVTDDKYELPVYIADTAQELADLAGTSKGCVHSSVNRWEKGKVKKTRYIRIRR